MRSQMPASRSRIRSPEPSGFRMDRQRRGRVAPTRDSDTRPNSGDEFVTGVHAVAEAISAGEKIERLVIGAKRENDPSIKSIVAGARAAAIPISFEPDEAFHRFRRENHQHVAALVKRFTYTPWTDVRAAVRADPNALVVALDHVEDPQNLGAVMRNAEGAGATAGVIPDRRRAGVT